MALRAAGKRVWSLEAGLSRVEVMRSSRMQGGTRGCWSEVRW
jgi:hypothetical protein